MGIYKRGSRWYIRWWVQGRKIERSLGPDIITRAQAEAVWKKFERNRLREKLGMLDPSTAKLGNFRDRYLAHREKQHLSPHTKNQDRKALKSIIEVLGEGRGLRAIHQKQIDDWAYVLLGRGCSPRTVNSYLSHIMAALNTAVDWGLLKDAPRIKKVRVPKRLPRALMPDEVELVLKKETNPARRAMWEFVLWTGLRRQEVVDLRWKHIHLGEQPWMQVVGKGDKERVVPLLPKAVQALKAMPQADVGPVWVFESRHHKTGPVAGSTTTRWFKATARAAGIEDVHFHDLRHTCATYMAARGVSEHVIQEILGHASITTTQIYTKGMARVANLYEAMMQGLE